MNRKQVSFSFAIPWPNLGQACAFARKWLLPNPGTLALMVIVALAVPALAGPSRAPTATSTSTISYQGRLADSSGNPLTDKVNIEFRIYDVPAGGVPLWTEMWTGGNAVDVSDGLFNVMLGSIDNTLASAIEGQDELYLGITVGTDSEMEPRVQLGSVPFSFQAQEALTVPDGSVTTAKLNNGAVTTAKLNIDNGLDMSGDLTVNGRIAVGAATGDMLIVGRHDSPNYTTKIDGNRITIDDGSFAPAHVNSYWDHLFLYTDEGSVYIRGHQGEIEDLIVSGDLTVQGAKSAVVDTACCGQRKLYAIESPEVRFTDEGLAQLENGVAHVDLDPIFLATIEGEYLIQVTPYGDASLYVAEVGPDYFVVRAREGDPDVTFSWRLSAHRKDYGGIRLETVSEAVMSD